MTVIAFHGWGAKSEDLRQDMGDPSWVDEYWDFDYGLFASADSDEPEGLTSLQLNEDCWPDTRGLRSQDLGGLARHSVDEDQLQRLKRIKDLILVGYSLGGSLIAELSHELPNLKGAILYESPMLTVDYPAGRFPAWVIWNRDSRKAKSSEAAQTTLAWKANGRHVTEEWGEGGHTRRVQRRSTLNRAHNWNQWLNPRIAWDVDKWSQAA